MLSLTVKRPAICAFVMPSATSARISRSRSDNSEFGSGPRAIVEELAGGAREDHVAVRHLADGGDRVARRIGLEHQAVGVALHRLEDRFAVRVGGEHQHAYRQMALTYLLEATDAAEEGHFQIEDDHVRFVLQDGLHEQQAVRDRGDHLDVRLILQQGL